MEILAKMFRWCHRSKMIVHLKTGLRTEVQYSIYSVCVGVLLVAICIVAFQYFKQYFKGIAICVSGE